MKNRILLATACLGLSSCATIQDPDFQDAALRVGLKALEIAAQEALKSQMQDQGPGLYPHPIIEIAGGSK